MWSNRWLEHRIYLQVDVSDEIWFKTLIYHFLFTQLTDLCFENQIAAIKVLERRIKRGMALLASGICWYSSSHKYDLCWFMNVNNLPLPGEMDARRSSFNGMWESKGIGIFTFQVCLIAPKKQHPPYYLLDMFLRVVNDSLKLWIIMVNVKVDLSHSM